MNGLKGLGICLIVFLMAGCGVNRQKAQIENLSKCKYELEAVDSLMLAGTSFKNVMQDGELNLSALPGLAIAMLRRDVPMEANLKLKVTNPTAKKAAINKFQYKIAFQQTDLAEGEVEQKLSIDPNQSAVVPIKIKMNLYESLKSDGIQDFLKALGSNSGNKGVLTLKIKPAITIAGQSFYYPGYITIDKEVSQKLLF